MKGLVHEARVSQSVERYTPAWVFEVLGLTFDVDVASPGAGKVPWIPAQTHFTREMDAFKQEWFGRIFCNWPYAEQDQMWCECFVAHGNGIALSFARPDTDWHQYMTSKVDAFSFTDGRISFIDGATGEEMGSPGAGSAFFAMGDECVAALKQAVGRGTKRCQFGPVLRRY